MRATGVCPNASNERDCVGVRGWRLSHVGWHDHEVNAGIGALDGAEFGRYESHVNAEVDQILEAAMKLPDSERALVAAILTDSIGDGSTQEEIDASWRAEVQRRLEDVEAGRSQPIPWEEVRERLRAKVRKNEKGSQTVVCEPFVDSGDRI